MPASDGCRMIVRVEWLEVEWSRSRIVGLSNVRMVAIRSVGEDEERK